ncbi:MAG: glycerol-3-phosphate 1-O-acyltransferase PlsY [Rhodospirillaceae bacterium]|nr:glycerol-3-phosphate 1-O-acyltransferase PlsY [Rhodospirillaceae bacterium]
MLIQLEPTSWAFTLIVVGGYLIGSIPFGLLLTKTAGAGDIRDIGSGNIGATNVLRTGRRGLAAATLLLDGGKGALAVWIGTMMAIPQAAEVGGLVAGAGAVLGHNFPNWLRFQGGKGVATTLGMMLGAAPIVGAMASVTWIAMVIIFRYSSLAALIALAVAPLFAILLGMTNPALMFLALAVLGWVRHWANIGRLLKGEEPQIGHS